MLIRLFCGFMVFVLATCIAYFALAFGAFIANGYVTGTFALWAIEVAAAFGGGCGLATFLFMPD